MQIDRSRFLLLSATIATGCSSSQAPPGDVTVATPVEVQPSTGDEPVDDGRPEENAVSAAPSMSLQQMCDQLEPPPGPHCESFVDTKNDCSALIAGLEPDAAEKAVHCLSSRSKSEAICRYEAIQECFLIGTSTTMAEPRLQSQCAQVVKQCSGYRWARGDLTMETCGSVMAAVKDSLEGEMISCMREGCGLGHCVWRLR